MEQIQNGNIGGNIEVLKKLPGNFKRRLKLIDLILIYTIIQVIIISHCTMQKRGLYFSNGIACQCKPLSEKCIV